jgi:hypothetical protein
MSQRLSPDRRSFKQFFSALSQQIQRQGLRGNADGRIDPQWRPVLTQIRQQIKGGRFDPDAVINHLTKLTQRVLGATGAGVWLFANDEIFYSAGAGDASNDERLRLEVISKLASVCQVSKASTGYDTSGPGHVNSLLVEPIYQGHNVAGALAVFSDELGAFTERDAASIQLLADVLAEALSKAEEAGLQQSMVLEPAAMLQLIERIIPGLRRILGNDGYSCPSRHDLSRSSPEPDLLTAGRGAIPEERRHAGEAVGGTRVELEQASPAQSFEDTTGPPAALMCNLAEASSVRPAQRLQRTKTSILNAGKSARNRVWVPTEYRSSWATGASPIVVVRRSLRHVRDFFLRAIKIANARLQMLLQSRPSLRPLLRAAPVLGIVVIVAIFFGLTTGLRNPRQITAPRVRKAAQENTAPLSAASPGHTETAQSDNVPMAGTPGVRVPHPSGKSASLKLSHLHVTDRTTERAMQALSRYELAGLRHQAVYGDDSAAFQLGMAYEIGRWVPQSCTTAAQWVARAASEGYAAAQYNLGLRYRDGDGVPVNDDEAVHWFRKAAAQQSSDAQLALLPLTAHQARFVASRP